MKRFALLAIVGLRTASSLVAQDAGVPAYPGARYDAPRSAKISTPHQRYYVFTTPDSMQNVVAFFEAQTGLRGSPISQGAVLFSLKGNPPVPVHGIVVEPNRPEFYPAGVGTVVTVFRMLGSRDTVTSFAAGALPKADSSGAFNSAAADSEQDYGRYRDGGRFRGAEPGARIRIPRSSGLKRPDHGGGKSRGGHDHLPGRD